MKKFTKDDLVTLEVIKYGGKQEVELRVQGYKSDGSVLCYWFNKSGDYQQGVFLEDQLKKKEPPQPFRYDPAIHEPMIYGG
ncbi:hypothetical protein [uncultured Pontibacter sp.]|uniref:hypothetical protein n=1 Tax=uncultured Pontibacter sp. TaxID=453356 RepID=UPI00263714BD|nr:hypothetical protein [uncultured Pontibacter sp.]